MTDVRLSDQSVTAASLPYDQADFLDERFEP